VGASHQESPIELQGSIFEIPIEFLRSVLKSPLNCKHLIEMPIEL
jgi:hypothetical protein